MDTILKIYHMSFHFIYHHVILPSVNMAQHNSLISRHNRLFHKNDRYCFILSLISNPVIVLNDWCLCWITKTTKI